MIVEISDIKEEHTDKCINCGVNTFPGRLSHRSTECGNNYFYNDYTDLQLKVDLTSCINKNGRVNIDKFLLENPSSKVI